MKTSKILIVVAALLLLACAKNVTEPELYSVTVSNHTNTQIVFQLINADAESAIESNQSEMIGTFPAADHSWLVCTQEIGYRCVIDTGNYYLDDDAACNVYADSVIWECD